MTQFHPTLGPMFGPNSLSVSDNEAMNAHNNCYCYTKGGEDDCFKTPVFKNGSSILTGMKKGDICLE